MPGNDELLPVHRTTKNKNFVKILSTGSLSQPTLAGGPWNHLIIAVKEEMQAWDALGNGREHSGTLRNTPEHSGTSARVRESARECAGRASPARPEHFFRTTITFYGVTFRGNSINQSCSACPDLQYIKRWALHSLVVVGGGGVKIGVKSTGSRTTPTLRNTP